MLCKLKFGVSSLRGRQPEANQNKNCFVPRSRNDDIIELT
jgi:hypothetical protein